MNHSISREMCDAANRLCRGSAVQGEFDDLLDCADFLGEVFMRTVSPAERRLQGATLTPQWLIDLQLDLISKSGQPDRIVDAGAGTGRYAITAARRWPKAAVIAVERDPDLAHAVQVNARAAHVPVEVRCQSFLDLELPRIDGRTAFVGNPPYVRHHDIPSAEKSWYSGQMRGLDLPSSQLAGLHLYFYLKAHLLGRPGDTGCFVTAAEWFETRYGASMRSLFTAMGGTRLVRVSPVDRIFPDALTTSVIGCWKQGHRGSVAIADLNGRRMIHRFDVPAADLAGMDRWPGHGRPISLTPPTGPTLGDLFKISRGQVTGCNRVWIASPETASFIPKRFLIPCVTDAKDVIDSGGDLHDAGRLHRVIDLPPDLDELSASERPKVERFLAWAQLQGAADGYIARHRKPWWRVGLGPPPAVVMSYMGRRPPAFAVNRCKARVLNIAHGMHPRGVLSDEALKRLTAWLNANVSLAHGRTYGGGMVKFEPGDAMAIPLSMSLLQPAA